MSKSVEKDDSSSSAAAPLLSNQQQQQQQQQTQTPPPGYYRIDIRIFVLLLTSVMAISFVAGVVLVPSLGKLLHKIISDTRHGGDGITTTISSSSSSSSNTGSIDISDKAKVVRDAYLINASEGWKKSAQNKERTTKSSSTTTTTSTELHLPAGQHLLVDMKGVDRLFLNSEERLSKAIVDTVKLAGLTLLSYHCHSLDPAGVSCVGVLLESHISFHTWPDEGVITLDLFTCGSKPLLPVVATIEEQFGIGTNVKTQWSHELRGFRSDEEKKKNVLADSSDLSFWVLSSLNMHSKKQIYSGTTKFQRVDIWDIVDSVDTPTYDDVIKYNMTPGDPRLFDLDYKTPDRILFLDGILQSISASERIYHEAMVHPAMFAHPHPKRVAILGGGEGATLREVLKHKTVEKATMIEIDEELVTLSRQYLAYCNDCSDLVNRANNCFDDPIADMQYSDGVKWFVDRNDGNQVSQYETYDVLLVDALDPEDSTEISDMLYSDEKFLSAMVNSLSEEGVLAIQIGTAATIDDPRAEYGLYKNREKLFNMFEAMEQVQAILVYEEPHCGFLEPHAFILICKSVDCRSRWYARSDQVDYEIYDRISRTHSKDRALSFYDGTTQHSYQWPKKGWETVYCRRDPMPFECSYRSISKKVEMFEMDLEDESKNSFRVEVETDDSSKKISKVFTKVRIPKGSFIMPEHLASSLQVTTRNIEGLQNNVKVGGGRVAIIEDLLEFFDTYAHESEMAGSKQHYVEIGGTVLIRRVPTKDEANIEKWMPQHPSGQRPKYSPVYERNRMSLDVFIVASRDIEEGEELLMPLTM